MVIDCLVLALYVIGMVAIAVYTKNRSKTVDDYFFGVKGFNVLERQTAKAVLIKEREFVSVE